MCCRPKLQLLLQCLLIATVPCVLHAADVNTAVTYIAGPNNCFSPVGYTDAAVCQGANQAPLGTFVPPPVGSSYIDPTFGAAIRVLSSAPSNHGYSSPSAFSASGRYAALSQNGTQVTVVNVNSGAVVYSSRPGSVTGDTIRWDAYDDETYYWFQGAAVMRHNLQANRTDTLVDYSTGERRFSLIKGGGTGDTSKDNWLSFWAPTENTVCAVDLSSVRTYCAGYQSAPVVSRVNIKTIDYTLMSKGVDSVSGKRYLLLMATPAMAVFSVDYARGTLSFEYRGGEFPSDIQGANGNGDGICDFGEKCMSAPHADTLEDADGQQYLVQSIDRERPCGRQLATFRLNAGPRLAQDTNTGGGRTTGLTLNRCGGGQYELWVSNHVGCAKSAPYCVISTDSVERSTLDLSTPINPTAHLGEVLVLSGNLLEIRRLAHHRSIHFNDTASMRYWSTARAAISPAGNEILWDTNFGRPGTGTYVAVASTQPTPNEGGNWAFESFSLETPTITGGIGTMGRVTLTSSPATGPVSCTVSASDPSAVSMPSSLEVPTGNSFGQFSISTAAVSARVEVVISVNCKGEGRSAVLTISPPPASAPSIAAVAFELQTRVGGFTSKYNNLVLNGPAPAGGLVCQLTSSAPALLSVSGSVVVPAGAMKGAFSLVSSAVAKTTPVNVTAVCGPAVKTATLTLLAPSLSVVGLELSSRVGGFTSRYNNVVLNGPAPADGLVCRISTSDPTLVGVPGTLVVPAGSGKAAFTVTAGSVSTLTAVAITAECGQASKAVTLKLLPPSVANLVFELSTRPGGFSSPYNSVILNGPAPTGGLTCLLTSSDPTLLVVPASVIVPSGAMIVKFPLSAGLVSVPTPVTVTIVGGNSTKTAVTTILPR